MSGNVEPLRRRLALDWSPSQVALALRDEPHGAALIGSWLGSEALLATSPVTVLEPDCGLDPFEALDRLPRIDPRAARDGGVFGGWIGYLGYQAGALIERLPGSPPRPHPLPDWWLGWYDHVLRLDPDGRWWFEALVTADRAEAIEERHQHLRDRLRGAPPEPGAVDLSSFRPTPSGDDHHKAVRRALELIAAGDIYQANVCLRLSARRGSGAPVDVFTTGLARLGPTYGAHLDLGEHRAVTSFSPEQFLRRRGTTVTTAPIKGTRRRHGGADTEDRSRTELAASAKDRAENVMIVDLMRNDLGRVCVPGTVEVPRLLDIEPHPGVWHLVSEVVGQLHPSVGDGSLLRASFPPGSVTGAPKVRAMEVIAEVEATGREVYTGAIGMISPMAGAEWSVAIRTFEHHGADTWLGVGGGIVAESDPHAELVECMTKAGPLVKALGTSIDTDPPS